MTQTAPRTRTRARPATHEDATEARASGRTVSERNTTEHAPVGSVKVVSLPDGLVARISVRDGVTLNMGNLNSFRRDIGLELDFPLDTAEVLSSGGELLEGVQAVLDAAYESAQQWVSDRVSDAITDAEQYFQG